MGSQQSRAQANQHARELIDQASEFKKLERRCRSLSQRSKASLEEFYALCKEADIPVDSPQRIVAEEAGIPVREVRR